MAVTLRLSRHGRKNMPFYRIVVQDKARFRDGKFLEIIGTYDALSNPPVAKINDERVKYWVSNGATPSSKVRDLIRKAIPNFIEAREKHQSEKITAKRRARKQRLKAGTKAKKS